MSLNVTNSHKTDLTYMYSYTILTYKIV